nr:MAG TPA: hypothetical protein [Caudoviricetes sp.]
MSSQIPLEATAFKIRRHNRPSPVVLYPLRSARPSDSRN